MSILRSIDGRFFQIPVGELDDHLISGERARELTTEWRKGKNQGGTLTPYGACFWFRNGELIPGY